MTWLRMERIIYMPISIYRIHRQCKLSQMFLVLLGFSIFCYIYWHYNTPSNVRIKRTDYRTQNILEVRSDGNGIGCKMPVLDTFNPKIMEFYKDVYDKEKCDEEDWVVCKFSKCYVTQSIMDKIRDISCVYKDIIYVNDNHYYIGEGVKLKGDEIYVLNRSDQVIVTCSGYDKKGYGFLPSKWSSHVAGYRPIKNEVTPKEDSYNILLLLFDSVSRQNFMRRLPKAFEFLTRELGAVVLKSYNIVGDGTASAIIPMLSGHFETELPDARQGRSRTYINSSYYIFSHLKKRGYRTAFFEDMAWLGTFQYRFNGFNESPTDHYLLPFFLDMTKLRFRDHANVYEPNSFIRQWAPKIGLAESKCIGSMPVHKFLFNYTAQFESRKILIQRNLKQLFGMDGKKFCVTFSSGLSHDDLGMISTADEDLVEFLKEFKDSGRLEDTALFVMSDHGARFFAIRNTYQGKMEERLPFVSLILPERLKRRRPQALVNLKSNAETLTTPYDIHSTILDILDMSDLRNNFTVRGAKIPRGLSFLDKIPLSRSCPEAGVTPYWCACAEWHNVSRSHPFYEPVATALADYINGVTEEIRSLCIKRKMLSIEAVYYLSQNPDLDDAFSRNHFNVTSLPTYFQARIIMSPKNAIYEGSMRYDVQNNFFNVSDENISRTNSYGDDPKCIFKSHPSLKKYCYCKT